MNINSIKSFAKVNLALNITGKLTTLHKIESIIAFVSLYDLITIKRINSKKHDISFNGNFSKSISRNDTVKSLFDILDRQKLLDDKKILSAAIYMNAKEDTKFYKEIIKDILCVAPEYGKKIARSIFSKDLKCGNIFMNLEEPPSKNNKIVLDKIEKEDKELEILEIDNTIVRESQIKRLKDIKKTRDNKKVKSILKQLTNACYNKKENLLELAINAAEERATLGEISSALEEAFGRYTAKNKTISGIYKMEIKNNETFKKALDLSNEFANKKGRRPRIMIAKMGQDGHDRGAKIIATSFADLGFDVDVGALFQTPEEATKQAIENDVHIIGISSLAAGHKTLVPEVIRTLKKFKREDILVILGGVIPQQDHNLLFKAGVSGIFGPGTIIAESAIEILQKIIKE